MDRTVALAIAVILCLGPLAAFAEPPTITYIEPDHAGPLGSVRIDRILGTNFAPDSDAAFLRGEDTYFATEVTVEGPGQLSCTLDVSGLDEGTYTLRVFNDEGFGDLTDAFRVGEDEPEIFAVNPSSAATNSQVAITDLAGMNFTADTAVFLESGTVSVEATGVAVPYINHLACAFDLAGVAPGEYDVVVVTPFGEAAFPGGFKVLDPGRAGGGDGKTALSGGGGCGIASGDGVLALLAALAALALLFRKSRRVLPVILVAALAVPAIASAQDDIPDGVAPDLRPFVPTFDFMGGLNVHVPRTLGQLDFAIGLWGGYEGDVLNLDDGGGEIDVIEGRASTWVGAAMGVTHYLDFGVLVPVTVFQSQDGALTDTPDAEEGPFDDLAGSGVGDIRVGIKGMALDPALHPVGLAFAADAAIPAGDADELMGSGAGLAGVGIILGGEIEGFHGSADIFYRFRLAKADTYGALDLADQFAFGVGLGYQFHPVVDLFGELQGATVAKNLFNETEESPLVGNLGLKLRPIPQLAVTVGGGAGLTAGVGASGWNLFAGLSAFPLRKFRGGDRDRDGVPDSDDRCPDQREDPDGFMDTDGCPDWDNDEDGVPDERDKCPAEVEDMDGFMDADGCPDVDNDGDGIKDAYDACPDEAEDFNGRFDDDGCPDAFLPRTLRALDDRILPARPIQFVGDSTTLTGDAEVILKDVAQYLRSNPGIAKMRVEVHTDNRLGAHRARDLTARQAARIVQALTEMGIDAQRLEGVGRGAEEPIASNRSARGREQNRRVEFVVLQKN